MSDLKKGGIDKKTAQKILKVWEETGAASPDQLRKMLLNRSLTTVGTVFVQLLLDAGASWGGFTTGSTIANSGEFFGKVILEYGAYFLGSYFAIGCFFDFFTIGILASTAFQYSTNTEAFLLAVRNLAGAQQTGINLVDKASVAVNTLKVAQALNTIADMLKEEAKADTAGTSTLSNLSAFLTLQKAEERGFDREKYGLSAEEAGQIALTFAKYDSNDDMKLELSEMRRLFTLEGQNLDDYESKAAVQLLDKNADGFIQFDEFVEWWVKKVKPEGEEVRILSFPSPAAVLRMAKLDMPNKGLALVYSFLLLAQVALAITILAVVGDQLWHVNWYGYYGYYNTVTYVYGECFMQASFLNSFSSVCGYAYWVAGLSLAVSIGLSIALCATGCGSDKVLLWTLQVLTDMTALKSPGPTKPDQVPVASAYPANPGKEYGLPPVNPTFAPTAHRATNPSRMASKIPSKSPLALAYSFLLLAQIALAITILAVVGDNLWHYSWYGYYGYNSTITYVYGECFMQESFVNSFHSVCGYSYWVAGLSIAVSLGIAVVQCANGALFVLQVPVASAYPTYPASPDKDVPYPPVNPTYPPAGAAV
ncbi:hypothetical protein WJX72_001138 [[Myrmecia] bisecta]|uniref:EF-hand domain-containing protein n=1 Tax=[Myrmecia] bisecta TaxID=41462 RepID=A0AAW1R4E5_9CHLO